VNVKIASVVIVLVTVLLLAQTVSIIDATHVSKDKDARKAAEEREKDLAKEEKTNGKDARKAAEEREKDLAKEEKTNGDEKRKAYADYRTAFKAWKTAKEALRTAVSLGDQTVIDAKKVISDNAKIDKDVAHKKYLIAKANN